MDRVVFSIDNKLKQKLSKVPDGEKATVIRMALRDFFRKVEYTEDDIETAIERGNEDGTCFGDPQ